MTASISHMGKYDYILFDWDGTLYKSLDLWHVSLKQSLIERGYIIDDQYVKSNYSKFKDSKQAKEIEDIDYIIENSLDLADQNYTGIDFYPGAVKLLKLLKKTKKLALVTTARSAPIDTLLKKHGLDNIFELVITADDVENIKPDPEPILKAIKELASDKEKTIMIGDSENDLIAANQAGIDSILFYPHGHAIHHEIDYLKSLNPTFVVNNLKSIVNLI